jgi:lysophospholipase L1-like esterase
LRLEPGVEVLHHSGEFDYVFRTNVLGFRGRLISESKPAGHRRLLVLGDSFVAGVGVTDESVFTERLANAWAGQRIDVVNVGRAGTSTIRELTLYREIGRRFDPDVVLLVYYLGNDLAEVVEEETDSELLDWRPDGGVRQLAYFWCPNIYLELAMQKRRSSAGAAAGRRSESEVVDWIRAEAASGGVMLTWRKADTVVFPRRFVDWPRRASCRATDTCRPVSILADSATAWILATSLHGGPGVELGTTWRSCVS